ncbi:MAG: alpha/beta hydrolase fold domain-containing protein [Dehalococcoidia bacterium]|nr:alpha/beta hydrolase fold domain-containing protein [Dehalococcoidia bacterium]
MRHSPSARNFGDRPLIINTPLMAWFVKHYTGNKQLDDPDVTPLLANLENLPPAFFYVGTQDPLHDDTVFMADAYRAAGNETEVRLYPGAPHGFDGFPIPAGIDATAAGDYFLARCLG